LLDFEFNRFLLAPRFRPLGCKLERLIRVDGGEGNEIGDSNGSGPSNGGRPLFLRDVD